MALNSSIPMPKRALDCYDTSPEAVQRRRYDAFRQASFRLSILPDTAARALLFRDTRHWKNHHRPRYLVNSILIEAAEMLEYFQWKDDLTSDERREFQTEVADVLIYLLYLADYLELDLNDIIRQKLLINSQKYPADHQALMKMPEFQVVRDEQIRIRRQLHLYRRLLQAIEAYQPYVGAHPVVPIGKWSSSNGGRFNFVVYGRETTTFWFVVRKELPTLCGDDLEAHIPHPGLAQKPPADLEEWSIQALAARIGLWIRQESGQSGTWVTAVESGFLSQVMRVLVTKLKAEIESLSNLDDEVGKASAIEAENELYREGSTKNFFTQGVHDIEAPPAEAPDTDVASTLTRIHADAPPPIPTPVVLDDCEDDDKDEDENNIDNKAAPHEQAPIDSPLKTDAPTPTHPPAGNATR